MARIRSVKPDLFGSYTLAGVCVEARFLFIGLFTEADDEGRLIDSPKRIAGAVFPHDEKITERHVERWLKDLERVGCILRYTSGEGRYICLPKWDEHQKISHPTPSRLPIPSGENREALRPDLGRERERERERERDLEREGRGKAAPPPPPHVQPVPAGPLPAEYRAWAEANGYGHLDLRRQWQRFLAYGRQSGRTASDWGAAWQLWLSNETPEETPEEAAARARRANRARLECELAGAVNAGEERLAAELRARIEEAS